MVYSLNPNKDLGHHCGLLVMQSTAGQKKEKFWKVWGVFGPEFHLVFLTVDYQQKISMFPTISITGKICPRGIPSPETVLKLLYASRGNI